MMTHRSEYSVYEPVRRRARIASKWDDLAGRHFDRYPLARLYLLALDAPRGVRRISILARCARAQKARHSEAGIPPAWSGEGA